MNHADDPGSPRGFLGSLGAGTVDFRTRGPRRGRVRIDPSGGSVVVRSRAERSGVEIANLIRQKQPASPFEPLEAARRERLAARLALASEAWSRGERVSLAPGIADALDELETATTPEGLEDLLERIQSARVEALGVIPTLERLTAPGGELLCHFPGRSLATGEAGVASRGFFDDLDRPPLTLWLDVIARPTAARDSAFESAVLVWVPPDRLDAARAGRRACPNGALAFAHEASRRLASQLVPLLEGEGEEKGEIGADRPIRSFGGS